MMYRILNYNWYQQNNMHALNRVSIKEKYHEEEKLFRILASTK